MAAEKTLGACAYCGRELARTGMARHLGACPKRKAAIEAADARPGKAGPMVHVQVHDRWSGSYWLHLEIDGSAPVSRLDEYLRAIWLDCCGHMSRFTGRGWGTEEIGMRKKAAAVFHPGTELMHMYDFGTTSYTVVRSVGVREGKRTTGHPIALMARNAPPDVPCQECDLPAAFLCMECMSEDAPGTLCEAHAGEHTHFDEDEFGGGPLPLLNSPRSGMCGYDGPADPPY